MGDSEITNYDLSGELSFCDYFYYIYLIDN